MSARYRTFSSFFIAALFLLMSISTIHAADITVGEACTLADAIAAANADEPRGGCPAGDGADVITLTEDIAIAGMLPPTSSPIIIQGRGYTLSGAKRDRLLRVVASQLTIHDLTVTGGKREPDFGGAIRVDSGASLRVLDSFFQDNVALSGGAIASFGQLEIENTNFVRNRANSAGGAVFRAGGGLSVVSSVFEGNMADRGGAISFSDGVGSISDSHFTGNEASNDGGGVAINEATLTIADSILQGNRADDDGGGVASYEANLTIADSVLHGNRAESDGGAINVGRSRLTLSNSRLLNNWAGQEGGALHSWRDTIGISESDISGNTAERDGGGISSQAEDMTIHASIVSDNSGSSGGGLSASGGIHRISGSIFSGNRAYWYGGAIESIGEKLQVHNSTFYRNRAVRKVGGLFLNGESELAHVTIAYNSAAEVGGLYISDDDRATLQLVNSILAGNSSGDCHGPLVKNISNLIEDGTCDPALQGDPQLAGLWGSPAVIVPASGSPVIDAGDQSRCIAIDQLGRHRAWGETCDLGAFEVDPSQELLLASLDAPESTEPKQDPVAGIVVNEQCSLPDAIKSANRGWAVGGCPAGNAGPDTITLTADVTLSARLPGIGSDITIEGAGHTISGANKFRIFSVFPGPLTVNDLTMTEGRGAGGAAINATDGFITINRSKVIGNRSVGSILADGGGIYCFPCTLIINDSLIANNSTETRGGGIAWHGFPESYFLEIHNSVVTGNSALDGGGLDISGPDSLMHAIIRNTTISNNIAEDDGGGIGAYVGSETSYLDISNSAIVGNRAGGSGGGISSHANMRLSHVTVAGNIAESGGGLFTANEGATRLTHVTVAGNIAESGGGIYTLDEGAIQLRFSIIARNSGNDCVGNPEHNIAGLIGDGSCDSMLMGDPMLAELVEPEGGGTAYFPLGPGSPAIDGAFDAQCDGFDQIGTPRPQGAACDIGAIEYVPPADAEE